MNLSSSAIQVLEKRYLTRNNAGNVIESPEQMFERVARTVAGAERYESAVEYEEKFYKIMTNLEFLPNSPTLINAGKELGQLSACFVLPIDDSMDSIFTTLRDAALVQKSGGGCGFSFSNIRPVDDNVKSTNKCAGGPLAFIRIYDRALDVISQGGVRHGANMGCLRVDHPDIEDFIKLKEKCGEVPNFNISVGITDDFMASVRSNRKHQLINPRTGAVVKEVDAAKLFDLIVEHAWQNGEPGVLFLDEMNRCNVVPHMGVIEATNPCGEQPLLGYESCNLGSINLSRFIKVKEIDFERLEYVVKLAVRFLDNIIDMNRYPITAIETKTKSTRKIGLGVMGFADMLIKLGINYDTEEAVQLVHKIMGFIQKKAIEASTELAEVRGVFPAYRGSVWHMERGIRMRNAAVTTVAPTGTLSIIANCSSGVEPYYSKTIKKHIVNTILEEEIEFAKEDCFITARDIAPEWHIKIQAAFQAHTDSAVSKTINFGNSATREEIKRAYMLAHKLKCKGLTVYRDGSRDVQVLYDGSKDEPKKVVQKKDVCPSCGADVQMKEGCVTCSANCGWSACKVA
jgi:ribonucleoside-diphosphate reductase alpha chain